MKRWNKKAWPLLAGHRNGTTLEVWCPYCRKTHIHGWSKETPDSDAEHRIAHCHRGSPLYNKGYYITVLPKKRSEYQTVVVDG